MAETSLEMFWSEWKWERAIRKVASSGRNCQMVLGIHSSSPYQLGRGMDGVG